MNLNKLFAAQDMTVGPPWRRITEFAVPMLIGNLAQQLYSTVDTIVVGKYVGDLALSAVGSAGPILNLMLALFVGVSTGAGIVVSQYYGAKDRENLAKAIGNCLTLSLIASIVTMIVGPLATRPLLELLGTPESIIDWCQSYLTIFFLGAAGFTFYNILSGILRGMGDSLIPMLLTCGGVCGMRVCWLLLSGKLWPGRLLVMLSCYPLTWVATSTLFVVYYISFTKRRGIPL